MITAIIVDDEEKAIILLRRMLEKHCPDIRVVADAECVERAIELIESYNPQILFLDIEMNGKSGFDLLEAYPYPGHVVFITAYSEFAVKAFRFSVTDYLLKPVGIHELQDAVQKVRKLLDTPGANHSTGHKGTLRIPSTNGVAFVHISQIIRMEADGSYTRIIADKGRQFMSSYNLKHFEAHLDPSLFVRIHRSHVINLDKIDGIFHSDGLTVEMSDGTRIDVPRRNKRAFLEKVDLKN